MKALTALIIGLFISATLCADGVELSEYQPTPYIKLTQPEWSKHASIYQINTRQFTQEGTFKAAEQQLPRLKSLGVDILWLMPIHPIGEKNRKGTLGSPYSVKDYYGVNPEFGTLDDLKSFVKSAHKHGMKVILDWVANHTAWDNALVKHHPDWYEKDHNGNFRPTPWWDWSDIINLDYSNPEVRQYMTDALVYWVKEVNIDGYRADVAGFVPIDFWEQARKELDAVKPVYLLAEWESRDLHANAFNMTYAWTWHEAVHHTIQHQQDLSKLFVYYSWNESAFPRAAHRMTYVTNHDANAWEGTVFEKFGQGAEAALALSFVGEGLPLIYNGLEAGNARRLAFFEKDPIDWVEHPFNNLITRLNELLESNSALWHGNHGARMIRVWNSQPDQVFSFVRQNKRDKVFMVINFSDKPQSVKFEGNLHPGKYTDYLSNSVITIAENSNIELAPWAFKILIK